MPADPRQPPRDGVESLRRRPRVQSEVNDELAFHVDMTIQMLVNGGMSAADARAEAVRRFGDIAVVGGECRRFARQRDRGRARAEFIHEMRQDVAFALRQLRRAPGFAVTTALTLALGIGATAAVFSALYAVALQPVPFADADRIVRIVPERGGPGEDIVSGAELSAIRRRSDAFSAVAGQRGGAGFTVTGNAAPEVLSGMLVTANYFPMLGMSPRLGRGFLEADDVPGAPRVALVSHRLWTRRFAADTGLVGRTLRFNDEQYTVIGVMPPSLDVVDKDDDVWSPLQLTTEQLTNQGGSWLRVLARLAPGVTLAQAGDAARAALRSVARTPRDADVRAEARRYIDVVAGAARRRLLVLLGAVAFVLLIACVNVANLLLARGTSRARELALRAALGAGRGRLLRQLLTESVVLAVGGAVAGVLIAAALVKGLVAVGPEDVWRLDQSRVNGVVLAFTFAVAVVCGTLVGLLPALRGAGPAMLSALREGGRGNVGTGRDRLRALLVPAEVALAMTLLTGAGLLIRTAIQLQRVDPGFRPEHVMTARLLPPASRYSDAATIAPTYERILTAVASVPGVRAAGLVSVVPLSQSLLRTSVLPDGSARGADDRTSVDIRYASPGYFAAMGMPLRSGRDFTREDAAAAAPVAIVSASLARALWPGSNPVGRRIDAMRETRDTPHWLTVVGIVDDVHDTGLDAPPMPTLYMPFTQTPAGMWNVMSRSMVLVTRTLPVPESVVPALRAAVATIDASVPLTDERTMEGLLSQSVATARFNTTLLSTLGAIALLLASVGVYAVVAYFVSQRTREIGVRIALGATPRHIWALVLGRGLAPIAWGALVGVALSFATGRLLTEQLYGVKPDDPLTFAAVLATFLAVAIVATLLPARRAMRVTPARALGAE